MINNVLDLLVRKSLCTERQKIIVSSENRLTHRAINKDNNIVVHCNLDGDVFTSSDGTRADFIVLNLEKKNAYIIELKHGDIDKGIAQIITTREYYKNKLVDFSFKGRLVYASASHTVLNGLKTKKKRKEVSWIIISSVRYEESI